MTTDKASRLTRYQSFTPRRVWRSQMIPMPGNPQEMSERESSALGDALNVDGGGAGLVETVVWNERSGHIVGGNHRIQKIDALEGYNPATKVNDYEIDVAAIDVDEDDERAIVVLLNNRRLQGTPSVEALQAFIETIPESRRRKTGFSDGDCEFLLKASSKIEVAAEDKDVAASVWGSRARAVASQSTPASPEGENIFGASTGIARGSRPIRFWRDGGYLVDPVLDFGCGQEKNGWSEFDPFTRPDWSLLTTRYKTVMSNYVLTVQPADHLIYQAAALIAWVTEDDGQALIAVRSDLKTSQTSGKGTMTIKTPGEWLDILNIFFDAKQVNDKGGFLAFVGKPRRT